RVGSTARPAGQSDLPDRRRRLSIRAIVPTAPDSQSCPPLMSPVMSPRRTIAFDLDGTLVDTAPDLLGALNFVLGEIGLPQVDGSQLRKFVGGGARLMIERGLAFHGVEPEPGQVDRMLADFLQFYERHIADHSRPFPGAADTLDALAARDA